MVQEVEQLARKYALQNAVQHGGAANPKAILGKILAERADLRPKAQELGPVIAAQVEAVNAMPPADQKAALQAEDPALMERKKKAQHTGLKHLPDWEQTPKIVMRFAPNPNGPATLGHSRGIVVHVEYQHMYKDLGKPFSMLLRYDDTDPAVKPPVPEAYDAIREDFEWLGGRADHEIRASDRVPVYYEHAVKLIDQGGAYVCQCPADDFRALKNAGKPCPHRGRTPQENREAWQRMLDGELSAGAAVLRVATDIQHKDPALRDWVAFRIVQTPHPMVGDAFRVWPMLDFESAIEDHLQGMTHIVRGKDLIDSERKQQFVYDYFGWTYPKTLHWGRVKIHGAGKVSKSLLMQGVREGRFTGWDDVRAPTLAAYRRRGFQAAALRAFWVTMGLSEKDVAASMENLEAENRRIVEPTANRFFFVPAPVTVAVSGLPKEGVVGHSPYHPDLPERGTRKVLVGGPDAPPAVLLPGEDVARLKPGDLMRLKDWGNLRWQGDGKAEYAGDDVAVTKQGVPILQWCPGRMRQTMEAQLLMPDGSVVEGVAEPAAGKDLGKVVQFERVGFACIEAAGGALRAVFTHA